MDVVAQEIVTRFSDQGRHSLCHYKIINNKVTKALHFTQETQDADEICSCALLLYTSAV